MQHLEKIFTETDTTYIAPNKYNLTFMVEQSFWHERYRLGTLSLIHIYEQTRPL